MNAAMIFGALIMGALLGLVPGIVGYKKEKRGLAIGGFIACVVGSFILGLFLSIPTCVIFTVIIVLSSKKATQSPIGPATTVYNHSAEVNTGYCSRCGDPLVPGRGFCAKCDNRCPSCGEPVPTGMVFCAKCGTKIH